MGLLTFGLNVTLDGCCDHREGIADDELHDYFTQLMDAAGAMLWGRVTYELMESAWPAVARDENAPRAMRDWARKLEAKPKYVVSASRRDFPWNNTFRVEGDLREAVMELKEKTPQGVLVGSPTLSSALERLGLIDEYRLVVHPVLAGHGPRLFQGLAPSRRLELVSTHPPEVRPGGAALPPQRGMTRSGRTVLLVEPSSRSPPHGAPLSTPASSGSSPRGAERNRTRGWYEVSAPRPPASCGTAPCARGRRTPPPGQGCGPCRPARCCPMVESPPSALGTRWSYSSCQRLSQWVPSGAT